jgi:hypothetical protein
MSMGLAPAATFFSPSLTMIWARTVAVVVPSPAMSLVFGGGLLQELRAHVLERVGQLDLLRHRHAVVRHGRRAILLIQGYIAPFRAEGGCHCVRQNVHATLQAAARFLIEDQLLCHMCSPLLNSVLGVQSA